MALEYVYPTSTELREVERDLMPVMEGEDPVFFNELFPVEESDAYKLEWEQRDNFSGLQGARGLNGEPSRVQMVGSNRFETEPGVYGEYIEIDEEILSKRAPIAQFSGRIDLTDLTMDAQRQLLQRRIDRERWLGWRALTNGEFIVAAEHGGYEHRDRWVIDEITATPAFSSLTTATPIAFFLAMMLQGRGTSSTFDSSAKVYLNQVTANRILGNSNAADMAGRYRINGGNTVISLEEVNQVLKSRGLPILEVYDKGYNTTKDRSSFVPFIPDGIGIMVGRRPAGAAVGAYRLTANVNNDFAPGPYTVVIDTAGRSVPRKVQVHDGHNGGPVIFYPSAVKRLQLG